MNPLPTLCTAQHLRTAAALTLLLLANLPAAAGPGAHGPNGEHLDSPATARTTSALPRVDAQTETFELVAELRASELVVLIDRYATNEPVLGARLDVESGPLKAVATYRAEQGDYAVTDAALLKALAAPGEHSLVFTLLAGQDSDLLDGTLVGTAGHATTGSAQSEHDRTHALERAAWTGAAVLALGLVSGVAWWRQRRRAAGPLQGGL